MKSAAIEIIRTLRQHRHQAYLVGGCVRDILLGREPVDFDIATDAAPDDVMQIFPDTYAVGAQFGVVLVPVKQGETQDTIEVATFRNDGVYSDGRHPDQVSFSKLPEEDVKRRDFTINGLLLDPLDHDKVLDYVGGQAYLKAGIIRSIGEPLLRFGEDKLRMLRAVRFAARFGYEIEAGTFCAIRGRAGDINQVSLERVRDEIVKMLTEGKARRAFELLDEAGLLRHILPEIAAMKGVDQPPEYHPEGDVWTHTLILLEGLEPSCSPTLALGALLHDVGKPPTFRRAPDRIRFDGHADIGSKMAEAICRRLRFPNADIDRVSAIVANHMKFPELPKMRESTWKRFLRQPYFEEHLEMHRLDCRASHGDLSLYNLAKERLQSTPAEQIHPQPLLTGHDLIAAGYSSGPGFKEMLAEAENAQLDGSISAKEEALALIAQRFGRPATK